MRDKEGNIITLAEVPNPHIIVWGRSGEGKTWFCCRKVEEEFEQGHSVLIIDFSGSYTMQELEKNSFKYRGKNELQIFDVCESPFYWMIKSSSIEKLQTDIADALYDTLGINSYIQRALLEKAIFITFQRKKRWQLSEMISILEEMHEEEVMREIQADHANNILRLLTRLQPYGDIHNLYVKLDNAISKKKRPGIKIVQLSGFPEQKRRFLTQFLTEILRKEVSGNPHHGYNMILLDEFQFLPVKTGSPVSGMLREGRKYGISLILSTQFITEYSGEEQETLLQAGNILIFRPTDWDRKFSAEIVDFERKGQWQKVFRSLNIGEAVLKGNYHINNNRTVQSTPIVCKI